MAFFSNLFKKKNCSVCNGEIGLLGNRKLEDGNLCKNCAAKLSPFFSDRRNSTVQQITEQLEYREENKQAVAAFHITRTLGEATQVLVDEDACKFMVTDDRNIEKANPDVLDFSQVTSCRLNIEEDCSEDQHQDEEGNYVSYNPPRYKFYYNFYITIGVNHPYFDEIQFQLNRISVDLTKGNSVPMHRKPNPEYNCDFKEYEDMGNEIVAILIEGRQQAREVAQSAAAPKQSVTCPYCKAPTIPDAQGRCEYCGGAIST